ncbi:MAG: hypothetical protein FWG25_09960 [Promicromonosporaceae bacterium]|nr:hypothetical protein [Promicromonosporaceae bacterium]
MKRKQAVIHLGGCLLVGSLLALASAPAWAYAVLALLAVPSILTALLPEPDHGA